MSLLISMIMLAGIWFLAVTIPGPNLLEVSQLSMSDTRKSGLLIALGVSAGVPIWATASLVALSVIFNHASWLYDIIRILGG